jgi:hypothetical protein
MLTSLEPAIARLETFFAALDTRPGVIARRYSISPLQDERLVEIL